MKVKQSTIFYTCFNGHDVEWGKPLCPICGTTAMPKIEEPQMLGDELEAEIINQDNLKTDPAEQVVITLEQREETLLRYLQNIIIASHEDQISCENILIAARSAFKDGDAKRKEMLEPVRKEQDRINNIFKRYLDKLTVGIDAVNKALQRWRAEQERIAQEELQRILTEQAEAIAASKITGEVIELPTESIPVVMKTSHADIGSVTYREGFDIQIVNPDLVPRDLCVPDTLKIRKRVESGVMEIPGILITKKIITVAKRGH